MAMSMAGYADVEDLDVAELDEAEVVAILG